MLRAKTLAGLAMIAGTIAYVTLGGNHCPAQKVRWERCEGWLMDWSTPQGRRTHGRVRDSEGPWTGHAQMRCQRQADGSVKWEIESATCRQKTEKKNEPDRRHRRRRLQRAVQMKIETLAGNAGANMSGDTPDKVVFVDIDTVIISNIDYLKSAAGA